jgi:hypothetical protein
MTDLFRFVALRAPLRLGHPDAIDLSAKTDFQGELAKVHDHENGSLAALIELAKRIVAVFAHGGFGSQLVDVQALDVSVYDQFGAAAASAKARAELAQVIQAAFGRSAAELVADPSFAKLADALRDSIVAVFLDPTISAPPIAELTRLLRLVVLINRVVEQDPALDSGGAIQSALNTTLVLPSPIFPLTKNGPQPVGVGDLLVVKQQLKRYEGGDIANIENILRGEKREKVNSHTLTMDTTVVTETSKTTEETKSLDVTERFELKTESENVVKEDLATNAGVNVSAKYGGVEINANANVAYSLSKEQSSKAATDHAKDVVSRAASRVMETVRRQETVRTIEKFRETEDHTFDNTGRGKQNVSGVYQWLNKVYEAQVFNYGSRLMFDLMVPEPAAFILDALSSSKVEQLIRPPEPFVLVRTNPVNPALVRPVRPDDLGPDGLLLPGLASRPILPSDMHEGENDVLYYGQFIGKFGAVGINAPPAATTTVSKSLTANRDDHDHLAAADDLTIPDGYQATDIAVSGGFALYEQQDGDESMTVFVGRHQFQCRGQGNLQPQIALLANPINQAIDEQGSIPIAVETTQARDFAVAVDVSCQRTIAAFTQWQLETHGTLLTAYENLVGAYNDKVAAQKMQQSSAQSLGDNPEQNRLIERTELKKACIGRLAGTDIYDADLGDVKENAPPPSFPRGNVPPATNANIVGGDQGAFLRFFEQAFEWEHIMYVFYPYYWGRRAKWYGSAIADNPDPLFAEFLKAGSARVVVPVRLQLEGDVRYFLMTGQIWGGGAMPGITDDDYLPITEEIKARDDAPGAEVPQGDSWEVKLPTTLIQLRSDDTLPIWEKFEVGGRDVWVPGRMVSGKWTPDYGQLDASGKWSP